MADGWRSLSARLLDGLQLHRELRVPVPRLVRLGRLRAQRARRVRGRGLEEQRSNLQAEGNRTGKEVGMLIKGGAPPGSDEVKALREKGNRIKQQVAVLEEEEKGLEAKLREQLLALPNLPSADAPDGKNEADNVEVKRWGEPRQGKELEEHGQ